MSAEEMAIYFFLIGLGFLGVILFIGFFPFGEVWKKCRIKSAQERMRVERLGYTDEDGFVCNIEVWWNSKYGQLENDVKRLAEEAAKIANSTEKEKGFANATMHFYVDSEGFYTVSNRYHSSNFFTISAIYQYFGNGYEEALYVGNFYSFNDAREKFNSLCMSYYNKIAGIKR